MDRLKQLYFWLTVVAGVLVGLMSQGKIPSGKWASGIGLAIVVLKLAATELARRWDPNAGKDQP